MNHTQDFLRQIVESADLRPSDYAIAKYMASKYGWSQRTGVNFRKGVSTPSEPHALDIAAELGLDPGYVLACVSADRARDDAVRDWWERTAERLRSSAAAVIMSAALALVLAGGMFAPSKAYASAFTSPAASPVIHYAQKLAAAVRRLLRETADALEAFFEGLLFAT